MHILEIRTPPRKNASADEVYIRGYILPPAADQVRCEGTEDEIPQAVVADTGQMVIFRAGDVLGMAPVGRRGTARIDMEKVKER